MNSTTNLPILVTKYDKSSCDIGIVHLGYGAFHRAHQAVFIDSYMDKTGDLAWGIAAVNLRAAEADHFATNDASKDGYLLKSIAPSGEVSLSRVRSHVAFADWSSARADAEALLSLASVKMVTITVTESGYYTDPKGNLDPNDATIAQEIAGGEGTSIYAYLAAALRARMEALGEPITVCCCDNIRQNGKMLKRNFNAYLDEMGATELRNWVKSNVAFPCSMVDRITPRSTDALSAELAPLNSGTSGAPVMAEAFIQWVLEDNFAAPMPDLAAADVVVTNDVDPFEETKIRVLNGGHTGLTYLAALHGIETFDEAMRNPELEAHFWAFERDEVLPAITIDLPFSKESYLDSIAARFANRAIGDTVARICADGMAKFSIFIRPTLEGCLNQGIMPHSSIKSIASWHCFARHAQAGKFPFVYVEPSLDQLHKILGTDAFATSQQLWGNLPTQYPEFVVTLRAAIKEMEQKWPI